MKTQWIHRLSGLTSVVLFLAILSAANALLTGLRWRLDLTEEKVYSLSDGTRALLGQLDRDVTLKFYFSSSLEGVPIPLKQYAQRVTELLREYEMHSRGRLTVETYDPRPDSDEEEWAQRYGVAQQTLGLLGGGPSLYIGLVGVSGGREAVIPVLSPTQEPELEYLVTRLVAEVTREKRPRIGILSSLPLMGQSPIMRGGPGGTPPWAVIQELQRLYEVVFVPATEETLPDNLDLLIVVHPVNLSEETVFAIDQYVLKGGHLLAFVDPSCLVDLERAQPEYWGRPPRDLSGFYRLLKTWGLEQDSANVVADLKFATRVRTASGNVARNVSWLSLQDEAISREEVVTRALNTLLLPVAGYFKGSPAEGLTQTVLVRTSGQAGTIPLALAEFSEDGGVQSFTSSGQPLPLAVRLQGRFKTAFPDGRPKAAVPEAGAPPPPKAEDEALKESAADGVVLLVGDADLLADRFSVRNIQFFGHTLREALNDNLNFVVNLVEQLSGNPALIGLRSRGTFSRPFTRVMELERQAQDRWRREETELQTKLQATQARFDELQAAKDPKQAYILSPEQQREIEKFRQELFATRRALKEVRKNLRQDIERLGMQLKVLNMALMPTLVGLLGLFHGWRRRRA